MYIMFVVVLPVLGSMIFPSDYLGLIYAQLTLPFRDVRYSYPNYTTDSYNLPFLNILTSLIYPLFS